MILPHTLSFLPNYFRWKGKYNSFSYFFLRPHLQHREVPRIGVKSELQMLAYTTATAIPDPSCICDLCHSLQQCEILNPLNEAKDRTHILMDTGWVLNLLSHNGNSTWHTFKKRYTDSRKTLEMRRALSQTMCIKEPPRCVFIVVKLVPKLFVQLNHSKYRFYKRSSYKKCQESKTRQQCFQPTKPISVNF